MKTFTNAKAVVWSFILSLSVRKGWLLSHKELLDPETLQIRRIYYNEGRYPNKTSIMNDQDLNLITSALDAVINPATPHNQRLEAHKICDNVKNSPECSLIGFSLAAKRTSSSHVKQFGLQMIIGNIKQNWGNTSRDIRTRTKSSIVELLENCEPDEACYVKDGIAHALTEVIKRTWPQEWPSMIPELIDKAKLGPTQVEVVELVFLRIAEDAAVLQNISASHRGQDIRHALSLSMEKLLGFFMDVLSTSAIRYAPLTQSTKDHEINESSMYLHLCITTLKTCQGYFEWANMELIFTNNGSNVDLLFRLMTDDNLKILATECLILLAQRKGQPADRKHVLVMMTEKYVKCVTQAIEHDFALTVNKETSYLFMKRIGQLLSCLVSQIIAAWTAEEGDTQEGFIKNLTGFTDFLDLVMNFMKLDDYSLSECVIPSVHHLLQNRGISKDDIMLSYIDRLIEMSSVKLVKCGDIELPVYAQYDFNDESELKSFLSNHRNNLLQILRGCTMALPNKTMCKILVWVDNYVDSQRQNSIITGSFTMWDTLKNIAEITIKTGLIYAERQAALDLAIVKMGIQLLQKILTCTCRDVQLSQCLLSIIGAFLPFLKHFHQSDEIVKAVVRKIMDMLQETGVHSENRPLAVSLYRRHCLSAIIHICKYFTYLVSPVYDAVAQELTRGFDVVGSHEKIPLFESLILVSADWKDYGRQKNLVSKILSATSDCLISTTDARFQTPTQFAKSIGLMSSAENFSNPDFNEFRRGVSFNVSLLLALIERSQVPEDSEALRIGGFLDEEGRIRNPCGEYVTSLMSLIVTLVEYFHSFWGDNVKSVIHRDYARSLDLRECEKKSMITANHTKEQEESEGKESWERMQTFVILVLENCYQILGKVGKCCCDLYDDPALFTSCLLRVFTNFTRLPELRVRSFTRQFLFYFLKYCPETRAQEVASPILNGFCNLMNPMLEQQWSAFAVKEQARLKIFENSDVDADDIEDMKESEEILKEQLLRSVSRVYLDLLVNVCVNKNPKKKQTQKESPVEDRESNDAEMQDVQDPAQSSASVFQLTEMGKSLLQTECSETLLKTALSCFSWNDTATVFKGIQLAWPLLKIFCTNPLTDDSAAQFIFTSVLKGLQMHGQHDGCSAQFIALCSYIYVCLRPGHDSLYALLQSVQGVDETALRTFDTGCFRYAEKKRKTQLRKLLNVIIQQHVGQKFKDAEVLGKLPKFFTHKKDPHAHRNSEIKSLVDLFKSDTV